MDEIHKLRAVFPKSKQPSRKCMDSTGAMSGMLDMMPPSGDCERLIKVYLNTWDPIHQIIDVPDFIYNCGRFWRQSHDERRIPFSVALLLVVAIGSALDDASQNQFPDLLHETISYAETWLSDLSNKRQKDLEVLCVHALLVIAMQCAAVIPDRIYRLTGSLVRSAMLMGLHYDPRVLHHKAEERHIQHRRRLWTSIVELDLQAALMVGLPPATRETDLRENATVLANDASRDTRNASTSQSGMNELAKALESQPPLQYALAKTLRIRLITGALSLDVFPTHNFADMRSKINVPLIGAGNEMSYTIADLYVQRSILAITRAQVKAQGHRVVEALLATARAGTTILRRMDQLDPTLNSTIMSKLSWNLFINLFSNEIYRSALVLCLGCKLSSSLSPYNGMIGEYTPQALIQAAENCLRHLLNNLDELGDHVRDLVALTLALESVRPESQKDEATKTAAMRRGFDYLKKTMYERRPAGAITAAGVTGASPAGTSGSSGQTPLGDFDFQFLANSFNFDLDFGLGMQAQDPSWGFHPQQAINLQGMPGAAGMVPPGQVGYAGNGGQAMGGMGGV